MRKLLIAHVVVLCSVLCLAAEEPPFWPCKPGDGEPYGHLTERDQAELVSLAKAKGLDLLPTLQKVYAGDEDALATVFRFASQLKSRGMPMRVYGSMVYSIFLNLGEAKGSEFVISVVSQEPAVRQRIRDFLWYPLFCAPQEQRAEAGRDARTEFPLLWPQEFEFGKDDSLFSKTPNNVSQPSDSPVTPPAKQAARQTAGD